MDSSNSMLYTVLERARMYLDEAMVDAKYSDDHMVRHLLAPSMADVITRCNMTADNPVLIQYPLSVAVDQAIYVLPTFVGEVWRIVEFDELGNVRREELPRGSWHYAGHNWRLEGNEIRFRPLPREAVEWVLEYVPSGEALPHYATDGTIDATLKILTLSSSPTIGGVDRAVNGYAGLMLRLIPATGAVEERVIESHDPDAGTVTVRSAFTHATAGTVIYEVALPGKQALYEALALRLALKLATARNVSQKKKEFIRQEYTQALKSVRDRLSNMQMRIPDHFDRDTVDSLREG